MSESLVKKLAVLAAALIILVISIVNSDNFFKPTTVFKEGTKIGYLNLSRIPWEMGYKTLQAKLSDPIYIHLDNSSRGVTPLEIGFGIDRDKLSKLTKTCKVPTLKIFCSKTSNEKIDPNEIITINTYVLAQFLDDVRDEAQPLAENNIVSFLDYTFRAVVPGTKVEIDMSDFVNKAAVANFITADRVGIQLTPEEPDNIEQINEATSNLIDSMSYPLLIKYGRNPIYISGEEIAGFIDIQTKDGINYGYVNGDKIGAYLDTISEDYANEDVVISKQASIDAIRRGVLFRASDYEINNAVILPLEGKSRTNGELHDKYVEVIKSQQRAYRFENGELVKTYIISTGLTWETPPGNYEVLGKQKMTISYFGSWYMPNYLPIGTVNGYRFGFHAIPYHMDAAGNIYSRDPNTMGSPATGGCIQLTEDDSLELFNWANVGMPVYVYE